MGDCVVLVLFLDHLRLSLAPIQEESALGSATLVSVDDDVDRSLEQLVGLADSVNSWVLEEVASQVQVLPGDHVAGAQMLCHCCCLLYWQILKTVIFSL